MSLIEKSLSEKRPSLANPALWVAFILFIILSCIGMMNHERWGDEIHAWNIAKGSQSFSDLINNTRYEGHPPLWYIILWSISKFTHDLDYVQVIHLTITILTVFILLFFSPLPKVAKMLIPFGYFFLYEYTVISRNYGIAALLAVCICLIIRKDFRYKLVLYYTLLFLLCTTHLLGILLAASLHLYFILFIKEMKATKKLLILHALIGVLIALPSLYFIFPPSDSELGTQFWMNRWSTSKLSAFIQTPILAVIPIPAWWNYNSWNTQFLIEAKNMYSVFRFVNLIAAIFILLIIFSVLKGNRKTLILFFTNLLLSFIVSVVSITLTAERHAGFLFIAFIVSYWLYCYEMSVTTRMKWIVNVLLIIQLAGGIFAVVKDIRYSFSNSYKIAELLKQVPADEKLVTDYWGLNTISAFLDRPAYCIDIQKEVSFIKWDKDLREMIEKKYRYYDGISDYFQKGKINSVYMLSTGSPATLSQDDPQLSKSYHVVLVNKIEGAIEKYSNLYLYRINKQ